MGSFYYRAGVIPRSFWEKHCNPSVFYSLSRFAFFESGAILKFAQGIFEHKNITITSDVYSHISEKLKNSSVYCYEEYIVPPFLPQFVPCFVGNLSLIFRFNPNKINKKEQAEVCSLKKFMICHYQIALEP